MIEIRTARPDELPEEKALWKLAFGDGDAYIDFFYDHWDPTRYSLVLRSDGVFSAMTALLPANLVLPDGTAVPSAYLYALATHPDARRQGFARFLLSYVDFFLQEQGKQCAVVVPTDRGLHRLYAKAGYAECFSSLSFTLDRPAIGSPRPSDRILPASPEEYGALREGQLAGKLHVGYPLPLLNYQQRVSRRARGDLFRLRVDGEEGCAVAEQGPDSTVWVKELLISPARRAGAAALLASALPARQYRFRGSAAGPEDPGGPVTAFGMTRWYDGALARAWLGKSGGYLGLALD